MDALKSLSDQKKEASADRGTNDEKRREEFQKKKKQVGEKREERLHLYKRGKRGLVQ